MRRGFDGGGAFGKRLWMQRRDIFRSVRTLMSIDKRVSPFKVREDLNVYRINASRRFFRSVRTLMSMDKRVSPLFKVREDLNSTGTAWRNPH